MHFTSPVCTNRTETSGPNNYPNKQYTVKTNGQLATTLSQNMILAFDIKLRNHPCWECVDCETKVDINNEIQKQFNTIVY